MPSAEPTAVPLSIACSTVPSAALEPLVAATGLYGQPRTTIVSLRDPLQPTPLCTIDGGDHVRFISATEVSYVANSSIWRASLTNDHNTVAVVSVQGGVLDLVWSPDGFNLAYLMYTDAPGLGTGSANQLWLKTGKAPARALTALIPLFGRGGSIDDENIVRFSHDGKYLLMVDTYVSGGAPPSPDQAAFQVHSIPDGNVVFVPPSALNPSDRGDFTTMAAWSHQSDRLYYRDPAGIQTWDPPRTQGTMAGGRSWSSPLVSPDDRFVAYVVRDIGNALEGQPHVEIRELGTNKVTVIPGVRGAPFFASGTVLFEVEYGPNPEQGPGPRYIPTGKGFAFDVRDNVETQTKGVISPIDSWPH